MKKASTVLFAVMVVALLVFPGTAAFTQDAGKALQFDGSNDYVDCGNDASLNFGTGSFTLEAWFNTSTSAAPGQARVILQKDGYSWQPGYMLRIGQLSGEEQKLSK